MRIGSLFSGVGGLDQGLERAGVGRSVWFVEADPFCRAVLAARFPGVPCYEDVRAVDYSRVERVDVLCGGPPCQPASVSGKRRGGSDDRWLWPEFARAVRALRPRLVLMENVSGLFSVDDGERPRGPDEFPRPFGAVLADADGSSAAEMAEAGYRVRWACVRASDAGAPHRRERVFLVGVRVDDVVRRAGRAARRRGADLADADLLDGHDGRRGAGDVRGERPAATGVPGRELADADDAGLGERRAGVAAAAAQPAAEREGGDGGRGGEGDGALADADGRGRGEVGEPGDGRPVGGGRAGAGHPPATQDGGARALADTEGAGRGERDARGARAGRPLARGAGTGADRAGRALADADGERPERRGARPARRGEGTGADDGGGALADAGRERLQAGRGRDAGEAWADAEPGPRGGRGASRGAASADDRALADAGDDGREGVAPVDGADRRVGEPRGDDAARRGARGRGEGRRATRCATCGAPSPRHVGDCPWTGRGVERVGVGADAYLACGCCGFADGAHDAGCGVADEPDESVGRAERDERAERAERVADAHDGRDDEREGEAPPPDGGAAPGRPEFWPRGRGVDVADADGGDVRLLAERDQRGERGEPATERGDAEPRDAREDGGRRAQSRLGRGAHGVPGGVDGRAAATQAEEAEEAEGAGRARAAARETEGAEEAAQAAGPDADLDEDDLDLDLDLDDEVDEGADLHVMGRAGVVCGVELDEENDPVVLTVPFLAVPDEPTRARAISAWCGWPAPPGQPQRPGEPPRTTARFPTSARQRNRRERLRVLGNAVVPAVGEVVGRWAMRLLREDLPGGGT